MNFIPVAQGGVGAQTAIKVKYNDVNVTIYQGLVKVKDKELVLGCRRKGRRGERRSKRV